MLGSTLLAVFVAGAAASSPAIRLPEATQQPSTPPSQTSADKPWPPPGVVRQGPGVVSPRLINDVKPNYRAQAMQHKIAGVIRLEAVVDVDGTVGEVRLTQSLDRKFGLDDEAVETLMKWKFVPGKKDGVDLPVLIDVEMSFSLRK
jgi:periplasmic protein TonB